MTALGEAPTLLLVDDDTDLTELVARMGARVGCKSIQAHSPEMALELYRTRGHEIALVITDLVMSGSDGRQFARDLRQMDPNVKMIISTGLMDISTDEVLEQTGAIGVLFKPYSSQDLADAIAAALGRPMPSAS